jgi:hypothetical protein
LRCKNLVDVYVNVNVHELWQISSQKRRQMRHVAENLRRAHVL